MNLLKMGRRMGSEEARRPQLNSMMVQYAASAPSHVGSLVMTARRRVKMRVTEIAHALLAGVSEQKRVERGRKLTKTREKKLWPSLPSVSAAGQAGTRMVVGSGK